MAKRTSNNLSQFVSALEFVSVAQRDVGNVYQRHCRIADGFATAFDGIIAASAPVDVAIDACPQTVLLTKALRQCGESYAMSETAGPSLTLRSGSFRARVPCVALADLAVSAKPDPPCAVIDDRFRTALDVVGKLASEEAQHIVSSSILMAGQSVLSTDRHMMFEYWHGNDLPPGLVLPKRFATALCGINKPLSQFGFSDTSATVYFDDGSWIKTQLYTEKWPDITNIINGQSNCQPIGNLFDAVNAVAPFSPDNDVIFGNMAVRSHKSADEGASHDTLDIGLKNEVQLKIKHLQMLKGHIHRIDIKGDGKKSFFFGDNFRGVVMHKTD